MQTCHAGINTGKKKTNDKQLFLKKRSMKETKQKGLHRVNDSVSEYPYLGPNKHGKNAEFVCRIYATLKLN